MDTNKKENVEDICIEELDETYTLINSYLKDLKNEISKVEGSS